MNVTFIQGTNEDAVAYAKDNDFTLIEMYDSVIGDNSILGIIWDDKGISPSGTVISLDCWQCSNTLAHMGCMVEGVVHFMERHQNLDKPFVFFSPDVEEAENYADRVRFLYNRRMLGI